MIPVQPQVLEPLVDSSLKSICALPGPFITVYLPAYRPGAADLPMATRLKAIVRRAAAELVDRRFPEPAANLLTPFDDLANDPAMLDGGGSSVIFRSRGDLRRFGIQKPVSERLVVAAHPYITPLFVDRIAERELYVLSISIKHLRLGRWRDGECTDVVLPPSIPKSLAEAGKFDQPDHNLENRSAAGSSRGQMRRVRFGTSSDDDGADRYLSNYWNLIDRELSRVLGGAPLVLIGIASEVAAYRRVAEYPRILEAKHTSGEHLTWNEMGKLAEEAALAAERLEAEKVLNEIREATHRDRVLSGVREVLESAHEGRVHKLLVAQGAEHSDLLGPLYSISETGLEGPQDLLNAAAVETIRAGGDVYLVESQQLGAFAPIAAILRYAPPAI